MSGNIPGNNRIKPQTIYTRSLGSSNIQAGGWKPSARPTNAYDTTTLRANSMARMRADANVYANRNTGSFGKLVQSSAKQETSPQEIMMLGMMGIEAGRAAVGLIKEIVDACSSDKADNSGRVTGGNNAAPGTKTGNVGKKDETSAGIKAKIETSAGTIKASVETLEAIKLTDIASLDTTNLTALKDQTPPIDVKVDISGLATIDIAGDIPTTAELETVKTQAELVKNNLSAANKGIGTIEIAGQRCASDLATAKAKLSGMKLDTPEYAQQQQCIKELEAKQQTLSKALEELKAIQAQLNTANTQLSELAEKLPSLVEEHNELVADRKEKEADEKKDLKELAADVTKLLGEISTAKRDGKVERKVAQLKALAPQITALKTLVEGHEAPDATVIAAADQALAQISSVTGWSAESQDPTGDEVKSGSISQAQLAEMNEKYGVDLKIGEETVIAGQKFKVTEDGQFLVNDKPVESGKNFFEQIEAVK